MRASQILASRRRKDYALKLTLGLMASLLSPSAIAWGAGADSLTMIPDLVQSNSRGDLNIDPKDAANLALDLQSALDSADHDMKKRQQLEPDGKFLEFFAAAFQKQRELRRPGITGIDNLAQPYLPPDDSGGGVEAVYASNQRRLILDQIATLRTIAGSTDQDGSALSDARIIGGSSISSAKDVVAVTQFLDGPVQGICSGVLVSKTIVLTAAHCVCLGINKAVRVGQDAFRGADYKQYAVFESHLLPDMKCPVRAFGTSEAEFEEEIRKAIVGKDVAALVLTERVIGGEPSVILNSFDFDLWKHSNSSYYIRAAGYGYTKIDSQGLNTYGRMQFVDIALRSIDCTGPTEEENFDCQKGFELVAAGAPNKPVQNTANRGSSVEPSTCGGDSGGPVYAPLMSADGKKTYQLIGLISRGSQARCAGANIISLLPNKSVMCWLSTYLPSNQPHDDQCNTSGTK